MKQGFVDWYYPQKKIKNKTGASGGLLQVQNSPPAPVNIQGRDTERVTAFQYLDAHVNNEPDWPDNTHFAQEGSEQTPSA